MTVWNRIFQKFDPIKEIINHAKIVEEASDMLPELFEKYFHNKPYEDLVDKIDKLEDLADDIKRNFRQNLKRGYMYRFERVDLLDFIDRQDKIIDFIEDIARMMALNTVELQENEFEKIIEIVNEVENMLDVFKRSVKYLEDILESDFSKETIEAEEKDIKELKWYERDIDSKVFIFGKWLYSQKNTMNAVDIFFLRNMVMILSSIADTSQNVSDRIHIIING